MTLFPFSARSIMVAIILAVACLVGLCSSNVCTIPNLSGCATCSEVDAALPYIYDPSCVNGGSGCISFTCCRYCGAAPYVPCNSANSPPPPPPNAPPPPPSNPPPSNPPPSNPPPSNPPPSSGSNNFPPMTERLRFINGGTVKIFIFYQVASSGPALPYPNPMPIAPGTYCDVHIPDQGLISTRFWPGWGCNSDGTNCQIGASGGVFPGGYGSGNGGLYCSAKGCSPAVDSKFEASFACLSNNPNCGSGIPTVDWADMSLVDGFTLPWALETTTPDGSLCSGSNGPVTSIDCSKLDMTRCPISENLSQGNGLVTPSFSSVPLNVLNPVTANVLSGCFAPCSKLTFSQWNPAGAFSPGAPQAAMYCCPPPITSPSCSAGPVAQTQYVELVHEMCPGVYAYAYDDGNGLFTCKAGTRFQVTFFDPLHYTASSEADSTVSSNDNTAIVTIVVPIVVCVVLIAIIVGAIVYKVRKAQHLEIA